MIQFPEIPQKVRAYFYRVILALIGVAVFKGWLKPDEAETWAFLATTVLAVANTSTSDD